MASELNSIEIVGIDLHIGSQITDLLPFETAFIKIASFIAKLREEGHSIESRYRRWARYKLLYKRRRSYIN